MVSDFGQRMFFIFSDNFPLVSKRLLAFCDRNTVLYEILLAVPGIPFEALDICKEPHEDSVYVSLYKSSGVGRDTLDVVVLVDRFKDFHQRLVVFFGERNGGFGFEAAFGGFFKCPSGAAGCGEGEAIF